MYLPPWMEIAVMLVSPPLICTLPRYQMIEAAGLADRTMHSKRRDSPTLTSIFFLFGWLLISTFRGGAENQRERARASLCGKIAKFVVKFFAFQEDVDPSRRNTNRRSSVRS